VSELCAPGKWKRTQVVNSDRGGREAILLLIKIVFGIFEIASIQNISPSTLYLEFRRHRQGSFECLDMVHCWYNPRFVPKRHPITISFF
jgi:hypothetical protein